MKDGAPAATILSTRKRRKAEYRWEMVAIQTMKKLEMWYLVGE